MKRLSACVLALALVLYPRAQGSELTLGIGAVESPAWRASGLRLRVLPGTLLELDIDHVVLADRPALRGIRLLCSPQSDPTGTRCDDVHFVLRIPGWGQIQGQGSARYRDAQHWNADLQVPGRRLRLRLDQSGTTLRASLDLRGQSAGELQRLAAAFQFIVPGEVSGRVDLHLDAQLAERTRAEARISARELSYGEPSGRYASEKLSAEATLGFDSADGRWRLTAATQGGQAYLEPLYFDFGALPLRVDGELVALDKAWNIERLRLVPGDAGTIELSGRLGADFKPRGLDARLSAADLRPLVATYLQPLLIGTVGDGLSAGGRANVQLSLRDGVPVTLVAQLAEVDITADKLGIALQGLSGNFAWSATESAASSLRWTGGAVQKVPLGVSEILFKAQGKGFELLAPWRQPLLEGALRVDKLVLHELGSAQLSADFKGSVEPIKLAALCKALGWPEFGGTLSGRLPGLTVREDVWTVDGALEAQAFDGSLRLDNLRAMQPFGVLPRVMADVELRGIDLERLTSAFSFGRITGRLDGEVKGLRLLNWSPVAFDARLYSTPGDRSKRRISQRAIDNISSIGGGPTGMLSRGFLSFFEDFAYARLGISCLLRDGVCQMDGVAPAKSKDGQQAYYLVQGRLLPRIDVVGYSQRVSWDQVVEQLKALRASGGPQVK
jgi:hypothetical protein